jgi:hypothetical protein
MIRRGPKKLWRRPRQRSVVLVGMLLWQKALSVRLLRKLAGINLTPSEIIASLELCELI